MLMFDRSTQLSRSSCNPAMHTLDTGQCADVVHGLYRVNLLTYDENILTIDTENRVIARLWFIGLTREVIASMCYMNLRKKFHIRKLDGYC